MKKVLSTIVLLSLLLVFVAPILVNAQTAAEPANSCTLRHTIKIKDFTCDKGSVIYFETHPNQAICCVLDPIYTAMDYVFTITMVLAVLFVIVGAFLLMTAAGDPEKMGTGRNWIVWALVGIAIAVISKVIPIIVQAVMGM